MANLPDIWSGRPFHPMTRLQRQIDRLFDEFSEWTKLETGFSPRVDVEEIDHKYLLSFDVPGMKKEDLKIEIENHQLLVSGERKEEHFEGTGPGTKPGSTEKEKKGGHHIYKSERLYGKFQRVFPLPTNVKIDQIEATFQDGVLKISIPKLALATTTQIHIGDGRKAA